jgi:hypothetical protein
MVTCHMVKTIMEVGHFLNRVAWLMSKRPDPSTTSGTTAFTVMQIFFPLATCVDGQR